MIYIETGSTDVYYNFGLEYYFTVEKQLPDTVFLFWRTTPTLMVGKYQNVLEEINKPYADQHGIHIVRRMSGGGTIYGQRDRQDPVHVSGLCAAAASDFPFCGEGNDPPDAATGRDCRGAGPDG